MFAGRSKLSAQSGLVEKSGKTNWHNFNREKWDVMVRLLFWVPGQCEIGAKIRLSIHWKKAGKTNWLNFSFEKWDLMFIYFFISFEFLASLKLAGKFNITYENIAEAPQSGLLQTFPANNLMWCFLFISHSCQLWKWYSFLLQFLGHEKFDVLFILSNCQTINCENWRENSMLNPDPLSDFNKC